MSDLQSEIVVREHEANKEAARLLGFALFNLNKGNLAATETLMRKAFRALTGHEWDSG